MAAYVSSIKPMSNDQNNRDIKPFHALVSLDCTFLKEKCLNIEKYLKRDNLLDIDGFDLFSELNILR